MKRSFDKQTTASLQAKIVAAVNALLKEEGIDAIASMTRANFTVNEISGNLKIIVKDSLSSSNKELNWYALANGLVPVGRYFQMKHGKKSFLATPVEFVRGKKKVVLEAMDGRRYMLSVEGYALQGKLELECHPTMSDEALEKIIEKSKAEVIDKVMNNLPVGEDFEESKVDLAW